MFLPQIFYVYYLFLTLTVFRSSLVGAKDYCDTSLCRYGNRHLACNNNGRFLFTCPFDAKLFDMSPYRDLLLREINTKRNEIAGGKLSGYLSAKRMATVEWDHELAYLASLNVKKCKMQHDKCYTTTKYKTPGQSIFTSIESNWGDDMHLDDILTKAIHRWWSEYKEGTMKLLKDIDYRNKAYSKIGHFTMLVTDDSNALGCAIAQYSKNDDKYTLLACNFAKVHYHGSSVYEDGAAASGCKTGRNPQYGNLCSVQEQYT